MQGINDQTLKAFRKDYEIRDNQIRFPLKNKDNQTIGFEVYESNSNTSDTEGVQKNCIWHSHFHPDISRTKKVFIFLSTIEALSFYQIQRPKIDFSESAFLSLNSRVGVTQLEAVLTLYPFTIKTQYYSAFTQDFNGLLYSLALEKRINPKFDFQLGRVEDRFEFTLNGKAYTLEWENLTFESLFLHLKMKPQLRILKSKIGDSFHDMLLILQKNSKISATTR